MLRPRCKHCGLPFAKFKSEGFLGCRGCYESFSDSLTAVLEEMHGTAFHKGKTPRTPGKTEGGCS